MPMNQFAYLRGTGWRSSRNHGPGLAVGIGAARLGRGDIARGGGVLDYGLERFLEGFHFRLGAYGDAHMRGPDGPGPADVDIAGGHGVDDFLGGALGIEHETVGLGWSVGITLGGEPIKCFLTDPGVQLFALGNEMLMLEAC